MTQGNSQVKLYVLLVFVWRRIGGGVRCVSEQRASDRIAMNLRGVARSACDDSSLFLCL